MLNRMIFRSLVFVVLLAFPLYCFADYKVVVKKNGKIIEGKLIAEDENSVTIMSQGTQLSYKKDTLDLERMKKLNEDYYAASDVRTLDRPVPEDTEAAPPGTSIADVAKQSRESKTAPPTTPPSDANERAFIIWIADLEEKVKVRATQGSQIELSKAKKALSHYRNRNSRTLSNVDRKLMLEQLVEALDFEYRKELEAGSPDEKIAAMKKKIEATRQELEKLE
jgi:hypothetical protein